MPVDRPSLFHAVRNVVVKLGSQVMTDAAGRLDAAFLAQVARQIATLRERDIRVTIVSSGAVAAGRAELGLDKKPADLGRLQAVAAVGQRRLMATWAEAFAPLKLHVAQVLLTRDDIDNRTRFLNLRNTIAACHELGAVPIINENDTISTDELIRISFGDNDILAALVAQALRADALILLSVVDGVLDADKRTVPSFESIDEATKHLQPVKTTMGKGGMNSKLEAARMTTGAGELLVVAHGREPDVLTRICAGEAVGTIFVPRAATRRTGKSRWIGSARGKGRIVVDAGAAHALAAGHKSLLAAGVTAVIGTFARGDLVDVVGPDETLVARGLSNYAGDEVDQIKGLRTADLRAKVGPGAYDEVIHRDNLVVVGAG